jgi:hypothetical protein
VGKEGWCSIKHTMVTAAFVAFKVGRGFSSFGAGGGRAAVCGEEASGDKSVFEGITTGGESERGGACAFPSRDNADIMAHRGLEITEELLGNGSRTA